MKAETERQDEQGLTRLDRWIMCFLEVFVSLGSVLVGMGVTALAVMASFFSEGWPVFNLLGLYAFGAMMLCLPLTLVRPKAASIAAGVFFAAMCTARLLETLFPPRGWVAPW